MAGLGNPGDEYGNTRHNVGFKVVDIIAGLTGAVFKKPFFQNYSSTETQSEHGRMVLLKPLTYMNLSGEGLRSYLRHNPFPEERILVIADQMDLPCGALRIKERGSTGGHRGLISVQETLGTEGYPRLWVGIGRPGPGMDVPDWVLSDFSEEDGKTSLPAWEKAAKALLQLPERGLEGLANVLNTRT